MNNRRLLIVAAAIVLGIVLVAALVWSQLSRSTVPVAQSQQSGPVEYVDFEVPGTIQSGDIQEGEEPFDTGVEGWEEQGVGDIVDENFPAQYRISGNLILPNDGMDANTTSPDMSTEEGLAANRKATEFVKATYDRPRDDATEWLSVGRALTQFGTPDMQNYATQVASREGAILPQWEGSHARIQPYFVNVTAIEGAGRDNYSVYACYAGYYTQVEPKGNVFGEMWCDTIGLEGSGTEWRVSSVDADSLGAVNLPQPIR